MLLVQSGSWRYMLGSSLVFSTIMLVGMFFMPESPRFLMHKGRTLEAFNVWYVFIRILVSQGISPLFDLSRTSAFTLSETPFKTHMSYFRNFIVNTHIL